MTPTSPAAWMMSLALHACVVGLLVLLAYTANLNRDEPPRILELVAGPGDDFAAKDAPAAGTASGVSVAIPKAEPTPPAPQPTPPAPAPVPVQPIQQEVPIIPAPQPVKKEAVKTPPKKEPPPKDIAKTIKANVEAAKRKAERDAAKERKKQEAITKAEFDRQQANNKKIASATTSKGTPTKVPKIDAEGIADGVRGGSSNSKKGAGGTALTRAEGELMELYYSDLLGKTRRAFEDDRPPGLSDTLKVTISVQSNPDGSLTNARIAQASGTPEFDRAVLAAVKRVRMVPRPKKDTETISFVFTMREE